MLRQHLQRQVGHGALAGALATRAQRSHMRLNLRRGPRLVQLQLQGGWVDEWETWVGGDGLGA